MCGHFKFHVSENNPIILLILFTSYNTESPPN